MEKQGAALEAHGRTRAGEALEHRAEQRGKVGAVQEAKGARQVHRGTRNERQGTRKALRGERKEIQGK